MGSFTNKSFAVLLDENWYNNCSWLLSKMRKGYLSVNQDKTNYDVSGVTIRTLHDSIVIDTYDVNMELTTGAMGGTEEVQAVNTSDLTPEFIYVNAF